MGETLYKNHSEARELFSTADAALGYGLTNLMFSGSAEELQMTEHTQPAILTHSIAAWTVLQSYLPSESVKAAAGLSLGEYSGLVSAGVLGFTDALHVVRERGIAMQNAVPPGAGAMAAVLGLAEAPLVEVVDHISSLYGVLEVANYNSPGQIVISGLKEAVAAAQDPLKAAGASRIIPLQVSAPFHCALLEPAAVKLADILTGVSVSQFMFKVIANVSGDFYPGVAEVKDLLVRQVINAVRWDQGVRRLLAEGFDTFIELGPGTTLSQFVRRIAKDVGVQVKLASLDCWDDLERVMGIL